MRFWSWCLLSFALAACGCAGGRSPAVTPSSKGGSSSSVRSNTPPRVVANRILVGKVMRAHVAGKFIVISFPPGRMPQLEQLFSIYRGGLMVGQARISGPQMDDAIVADLTSGEAEPGDEARDR
ncbi:MAG: hypothetical protein NTX27_19485 [Verrucomicrobia bacterium]|nr:hypothetical protein [Verrucomicrobiota bacterium]